MAILSEKGLRKIVKRQIEERYTLDVTRGDVRFRKCDLSNLASSELAVWYAKHFIYNPSLKVTTPGGPTKNVDKSAFLSFLRGEDSFDMTPDQLADYDKKVRQSVLRGGDNLVKKYVTALEYSITYLFGALAPAICAFFNQLIPAAGEKVDRDDQYAESDPDDPQFSAAVKQAVVNSAGKFVQRYGSGANTTRVIFSESLKNIVHPEEYAFFFPGTFISLVSDDEPGARIAFDREKKQLNRIVSDPSVNVGDIQNYFRDHFVDFSGEEFAEDFIDFIGTLVSSGDSTDRGSVLRAALSPIVFDAIRFYESKF